jgi:hypothetical protein
MGELTFDEIQILRELKKPPFDEVNPECNEGLRMASFEALWFY